ncbi:MAG: hypothetical protein V3U56_10105 [Syntrophobacteria bacterium]
MAVLPGVLGCRTLRRTVQVRLGTNTLRLPGGTSIFAVSRQQFMKYPGSVGLNYLQKSTRLVGYNLSILSILTPRLYKVIKLYI